VPVLPAVLVLEWFVRAANLARPDRVVACCRDLKVLAGVPLPDLDGGRRFQVVCRELREGEEVYLEVELCGQGGIRHYTAVVEMATAQREPDLAGLPPLGHGGAWPWTIEEAYAEHLFHGPDFQVLRSLEHLGAHGGSAALETGGLNWGPGPWLTNPAALDGGLQLTLLWGVHHKGRRSLPTSVGAFIPYRVPVPPGPLHCELRMQPAGRHEVVAHLLFLDAAGRPVAEMRDMCATLLQSTKNKVVA
jgi:hypothetical protein